MVELVSFLGFTHVIVELDALLVVSFLNVPVKIHTKSMLLVDDYRSLLQRILNSQVLYAFRETNKSADNLASLELSQLWDLILFSSPLVSCSGVFCIG